MREQEHLFREDLQCMKIDSAHPISEKGCYRLFGMLRHDYLEDNFSEKTN